MCKAFLGLGFIKEISTFIILLISYIGIYAQTCCSGGVPLSGNVGLSSEDKGLFQFQLDYDDNVLKTLKVGDRTLNDDSRVRHTRSVLFQVGYAITSDWSVDILASVVNQERKIRLGGSEDITRTFGLGDLALLLKYKWLSVGEPEHTSIVSGVGVKLPTGPSDLKNDFGLTINADLQPGSGAFDGIFWSQIIHRLAKRPSLTISSTFIYSRKGKNKDYLNAFMYKFGDELQVHIGIGDRLLLGKIMYDPSLQFRFRNASRDQQEKNVLENTGGKWIFIHQDNRFWLKENIAVHAGFDIPIFGKVEGTQLSPSYRINAGVYFRLSFIKNQKDIIEF